MNNTVNKYDSCVFQSQLISDKILVLKKREDYKFKLVAIVSVF